MIGDAIDLARQNNDLARQNNDLMRQLASGIANMIEQFDLQVRLQNEIAAVNTAAFAEYKNIHAGKEVVVLGAGPTLDKYVPLNDAVHIGVKNVCLKPNVVLDYYFHQHFYSLDSKINTCTSYLDNIISLKCKKFIGIYTDPSLGAECSESFFLKNDNKNTARYYVDHIPQKQWHPNICFHPLDGYATIMTPALQFALYTNPKRIYLVGCDTSYEGYFTKEQDTRTITSARNLKYLVFSFRRLKEFVQRWYPETEIISINPVNLKGLFHDVYTDENGTLVEDLDSVSERDFSDEAIRDFIDRHIEQVLIDRLYAESSCKECGKRDFVLARGLSDDNPDSIAVKCNCCGSIFSTN